MLDATIAQPDITLMLDLQGVIRSASLSEAFAAEGIETWVGRPWQDTVADLGADGIRRMVEDARGGGISAFRQVMQRFPSGLELAIEYTTVRLAGRTGLIAIGRNLQAVNELQSRLLATQQAREQDYWKLREVETRYRLLFDAAHDPVLLVGAGDLRVVEANPAAIRALGLGTGQAFLGEMAAEERGAFQATLARTREQGRAPGVLVHLNGGRDPWMVRPSLLTGEPGGVFLLQLTPMGAPSPRSDGTRRGALDEIVARLPDGFVLLDADGIVRHANPAFLDLAQVGAEAVALGAPLGRWLTRPGADAGVLLANLQRHHSVRLFTTTLQGEFGSETPVEISGTGSGGEHHPRQFGLLLRDVGRRIVVPAAGERLHAALAGVDAQVGKAPLLHLVRDTTAIVERHCIESALALADGNRTAAAELLGLSRQSLYKKLDRYDLHEATPPGR